MNRRAMLIVLVCVLMLGANRGFAAEIGADILETWVIPTANAFRLPPPPNSKTTAKELREVRDRVARRSQEDLASIRFWDAGPPAYRWMQLTEQTAVNAGLPAPFQTRALALVAAAIADATVVAWDSKYAYDRPHPSEMDHTFVPIVRVPNNPSYPSEYAVTAGAAAAVLGYLFPNQAEKFADMAKEAAASRIAAGTAFPSDVSSGLDLGRSVGKAVIRYAQGDGSGQSSSGFYRSTPGMRSSKTPVTPPAGFCPVPLS
jgi:hypothetical protein